MKNTVFFTLFVICSYMVQAQYAVKDIPEALLKNAYLVKRIDDTRIDIKNTGKAYYYRHYAYTILDEAADSYAVFVDRYDKFRDIISISGTLYDATGNKIKRLKKKDITDETGTSGSTLADDARYKIHSFYHKNYPYTVEYEVKVEMKGLFSLPEWQPVPATEVALEKAYFTIVTPKDYNLRYKQLRYTDVPVIKDEKSSKTYQWQLANQSAKRKEAFSPDWDDISTRVLTAPSQFEFGGYKGDMSDWQGFGKFMQALYNGRDVLPADVKAKVHALTDALKSDKEKINVLYKFMQDHTHYISIQLGIGGWQPLNATYVAEKKYGDCKALSNYMVALLKEAGIKANNVLIRAGDKKVKMLKDFSSNQFNHVIVCVPGNQDTTWLECTSQTVAPNYMGSFTGDRYALLVDDAGSSVVHTPQYNKHQNLQVRNIVATVNEAGKLHAKVVTQSSGLQQDDLHAIINSSTREEQKKRLLRIFPLSNYDVPAFAYFEDKMLEVPTIKETLEIESNNYATITGKRLFIRPNIITYTTKLAEEEKRENDISYSYAFIDKDSIQITIPEGYYLEAAPKPFSINSKFGSYSMNYKVEGNLILFQRVYERNSGLFPASDYENFIKFYNQIYKADRAKMVFVKKE